MLEMLANLYIMLGCKPQQQRTPPSVAEDSSDCLILSIMAGLHFTIIQKFFPRHEILFVRAQYPGQIGHSTTGYLCPFLLEDGQIIEQILSSLAPLSISWRGWSRSCNCNRRVVPPMCLNLPVLEKLTIGLPIKSPTSLLCKPLLVLVWWNPLNFIQKSLGIRLLANGTTQAALESFPLMNCEPFRHDRNVPFHRAFWWVILTMAPSL